MAVITTILGTIAFRDETARSNVRSSRTGNAVPEEESRGPVLKSWRVPQDIREALEGGYCGYDRNAPDVESGLAIGAKSFTYVIDLDYGKFIVHNFVAGHRVVFMLRSLPDEAGFVDTVHAKEYDYLDRGPHDRIQMFL